ncbi:hypothetical protein C8R43DRAFT_897082, partial [Mycena crocata]
LPTAQETVALCDAAGYGQNGIPFPLTGNTFAWIKYGGGVTMAEARTQHWAASGVNGDIDTAVYVPRVYFAFVFKRMGFIVMEHIIGRTVAECLKDPSVDKEGMYKAVAAAVQQLLALPPPAGIRPGPVGGGFIGHPCFDIHAPVKYKTVQELHDHFNNMLARDRIPDRVNFVDETASGLVFCHGDIHESNFILGPHGRIYAIDFEHMAFLPPSFTAYALKVPRYFTHRVAAYVEYPTSDATNANVRAIDFVRGRLIIYGNVAYGGPPLDIPALLLINE